MLWTFNEHGNKDGAVEKTIISESELGMIPSQYIYTKNSSHIMLIVPDSCSNSAWAMRQRCYIVYYKYRLLNLIFGSTHDLRKATRTNSHNKILSFHGKGCQKRKTQFTGRPSVNQCEKCNEYFLLLDAMKDTLAYTESWWHDIISCNSVCESYGTSLCTNKRKQERTECISQEADKYNNLWKNHNHRKKITKKT